MAWIAVGLTAASAGASYLNNKAKKKQETANQMANAAAMQYSPWTGMKPEMMGKTTGSDVASIMQGGLGGLMMAQQFKKPASPQSPSPVEGSPELAPVAVGASNAAATESAMNAKPSLYGEQGSPQLPGAQPAMPQLEGKSGYMNFGGTPMPAPVPVKTASAAPMPGQAPGYGGPLSPGYGTWTQMQDPNKKINYGFGY